MNIARYIIGMISNRFRHPRQHALAMKNHVIISYSTAFLLCTAIIIVARRSVERDNDNYAGISSRMLFLKGTNGSSSGWRSTIPLGSSRRDTSDRINVRLRRNLDSNDLSMYHTNNQFYREECIAEEKDYNRACYSPESNPSCPNDDGWDIKIYGNCIGSSDVEKACVRTDCASCKPGYYISADSGYGHVECSKAPDLTIWGVDDAGSVLYRKGIDGPWRHVGGKRFKQVYVSGDGRWVWGIASEDDAIFYREGLEGAWQYVPDGKLNQISVSYDSRWAWGTNGDNEVFYRNIGNGDSWHYVKDKKLKHVSVSCDGQWVWGTDDNDNIYYRNGPDGSWVIDRAGFLKEVAVSAHGHWIWGINSNDDVFYRNGIVNKTWHHMNGVKLKDISVSCDGKWIWGTDRKFRIVFLNGPSGFWHRVRNGLLKQISISLSNA